MLGSPSKDDQRNTGTESTQGSNGNPSGTKDDQRKVSTCSEVSTQLTTGSTGPSTGSTQGSDGNPRILQFGSTSTQSIAASASPTQFSQLIDLQPGQCFSPAATSSVPDGVDPEEAQRKYVDVERRREEDKKEKLKYCYLKEDDGDIMDLELFDSIRGIPQVVTGPILERPEIMAMKTTALLALIRTYEYIHLNGKGKEICKPVSTNTNKKADGESGPSVLRKRVIAYNFWRYLKSKGILPARYSRPHGNTSEYTSNEYARLVMVYTDANNRPLLCLTAQKADRNEMDVCDGNPGTQAHDMMCKQYNDFDCYKPVNDYGDEDGEVGALNPNDETIRIRSPASTKAVWSSMKSAFYICHKDWKRSGQMDPLSFPNFIKGKWHLLYLWKKYQDNPDMMNFITRSIPEEAVVDSQDQTRDNIADRAQAVMERAPRRNARAPVAVVQVPTAATPSTITMATAKKKDSAHLWLDSFSSDLLKAFSRDRDADNEEKTKKNKKNADGEQKAELLALRKERRECWKQCTEFEDQLETMAPGERRDLVQRRLNAEAKALRETEAEMAELAISIAGTTQNKKAKRSHEKTIEKVISIDDDDESEDDSEGKNNDDSGEDDPGDPDTPERLKERRKNKYFAKMPVLGKIHSWIQANKGLFKKKPVGPIVLEVVPKNFSEELWLLDHLLTNTALKSFVVQSKEDFDLLYHHVREVQRLPVFIMEMSTGLENGSDDSELIVETLRCQVDPVHIDGEAGVYGVMALLRFFDVDSGYEDSDESEDEHAESGLKLKKHNN
jgi:hypothetical protein